MCFIYDEETSTPMTRVLIYEVFFKREIYEQPLVWLSKA